MSKKNPRKFFITDGDDILVVGPKFFDLIAESEAKGVYVDVSAKLHEVMQEDIVYQEPSFIKTIKLSDGLERSLYKLQERFPLITQNIGLVERRSNGVRVGKA